MTAPCVFESLQTYLEAKRGRAAELSRHMEVTAGMLTAWSNGSKAIPPVRCVQIERFTAGQVPRQVLRSDWEELWPELARKLRKQARAHEVDAAKAGTAEGGAS